MSTRAIFTVLAVLIGFMGAGATADEMFLTPDDYGDARIGPSGSASLPEYASVLLNPDYPRSVTTLTQTPPEGTIFESPQVVFVEITGTDDIGITKTDRFRIDVIDPIPPTATINLPSAQTSPSGHAYYVTPTAVVPEITVADNTDPSPQVSITHNNEPYTAGTPISNIGAHQLSLTVVDASGNKFRMKKIFEVRNRPNLRQRFKLLNGIFQVTPYR